MKVEEALEDVLKDCRRRLETIKLSVPELDAGPVSKPPSYFPPPARVPPPAAPAPSPAPRTPPPAPRPEPTPAPAARSFEEVRAEIEEPEEIETFPPTPRPVRTPAPAPAAAPRAAAAPFLASKTARAALAVLAAGVLAALGSWAGRRAPAETQFELSDAQAFAFRPEGRVLLASRPPDLLEYSPEGLIVGRSDWAGRAASLSWNDGSLWSVDGESPEAVETRAGSRPVVFRLNHVPAAVFAKGDEIWTVEKGGHAVHQYLVSRSILGAMLQPLDLLELPDVVPQSIAVDGEGVLWALDADARALYRFRAEKGAYRRAASAPLSPILGPSVSLRGMALDGDGLWLLTAPGAPGGAALMRRIRLDRLQWSAN